MGNTISILRVFWQNRNDPTGTGSGTGSTRLGVAASPLSEVKVGDLAVSSADKLCEDELILLFSNYWISTQDLLNFRLVSKSWRDAATTVLLQRDACCVDLNVKIRTVEEDWGDAQEIRHESFIYKYGDKDETGNTLAQLTELMSNSPKFPICNFRIRGSSPHLLLDYGDHTNLMLFFKLHGDKIKIFAPAHSVSRKLVLDICTSYAPKLECLDLSGVGVETEAVLGNSQELALKWASEPLPFRTIRPGYNSNHSKNNQRAYSELTHLLLSSPSKLSHIEARLSNLAQVLEEGKGHLIKTFIFFNPELEESLNFMPLLQKFLELRPKLSKLFLNVSCSFDFNEMTLAPINELLEASRETLQTLYLNYLLSDEEARVLIPPMKNLKNMTLIALNVDDGVDGLNLVNDPDHPLSFFEDGILLGSKYFPSLLRVQIVSLGETVRASPGSFFRHFPENSLGQVDVLNLWTGDREHPKNFNLRWTIFPKIVPNLRILKFSCGQIRYLRSSLWMLSSLEFIEIYNISRNRKYLTDPDPGLVPFVDQFFTGFSLPMCHKLQRHQLPNHWTLDTEKTFTFLRVKRSIIDLHNLRELKLRFSPNFSVQFASHLTGVYAFSKMPHTKIIVSYDPDKINGDAADEHVHYLEGEGDASDDDENIYDDDFYPDWNCGGGKIDSESGNGKDAEVHFGEKDTMEFDDENENYEELCFGSIKPYVQIVREKQ